jgi:hypothetical protein
VGRSQYRDAADPDNDPGAIVFIFVGHAAARDVTPSAEGRLHWVPLKHLAAVRLMPDLPDLLSQLLGRSAADGPLFVARRS